MATVYRAYDPMFEREVALKILKRESLKDAQVRQRFERETKIIARLEHPAIVPVYDVGRDRDQLFFVMRFMAGGALIERIRRGSLSLAEIGHILQRIAAALDYAHSKGVIHRDVKPGNILFDEFENAYVSDFGIAKFAQGTPRLTHSGIIGTPTHMSPEQARGEEVDGRSDIYSLGVILFEMLSGKTPFEATTPLGMAFKHAAESPPHIRDINRNLPAGLEPILDKALAKDPSQRYASGAELADAFIATLAEPLPADISLATPIAPRPRIEAGELPAPPSTPPARRATSASWMVGGVILAAVAALAVLGYPKFAARPAHTPQPAIETTAPASPTRLSSALPAATQPSTAASTVTLPVPADPGGASKIALTANREIYLMNLDGSDIEPLTRTRTPKVDLQWLPGGSELLYIEGKCVHTIDVESAQKESGPLICFEDAPPEGFRVSPDGEWAAVSIAHRLLVLPFDRAALFEAASAFELQQLEGLCLDYADVTVRDARWSADGQRLAVRYESVRGSRRGDTIRVIEVNLDRCQAAATLIWDEFPADRFLPEGYERYPILPSYDWDGDQRFLFNSFIRNLSYGELYLYEMLPAAAHRLDPIDGVCCYGSAIFSPDGTHILLVFQDVREGAESQNQLYYIPLDQIGAGTEFKPLRLPPLFFPDPRENIQLALRPSLP
jgi:serine/threonine protein kinase